MTPPINLSNFVSEPAAQLPVADGVAARSLGSTQSEGIAFEEELSGEQQKLSSNSEENNSHSNSLTEKEVPKEKRDQKSPEKWDKENLSLEKKPNGIKHAMQVVMPVLSPVSPEIDHQGQVAVVEEGTNISSSSSHVYGQNEAASITGEEPVSLNSHVVPSTETRTENPLEKLHQSGEKTLFKVTPQEGETEPLSSVVESDEQKVQISAVSNKATAQSAKDVPVPVSSDFRPDKPILVAPSRPADSETKTPVETPQLNQTTNSNNLLGSVDQSSVAKHNEELAAKAAPATVEGKPSAKADVVQTNQSRRPRTDGSSEKAIQTARASAVSKATQSKETTSPNAPTPEVKQDQVNVKRSSETNRPVSANARSTEPVVTRETPRVVAERATQPARTPIAPTSTRAGETTSPNAPTSEVKGGHVNVERSSETNRLVSANARSNEPVVSRETPAQTSEAPKVVERTTQPVRTPIAPTNTRAAETTQSKEFQAVSAEEPTPSTISKTTRATLGAESTRNATVPSLNSGTVPSRSVIKDSQPAAKNNQKVSRKAKSGSRTHDRAGRNKFIQTSSTVGPMSVGTPQGNRSTPGVTAAQQNRAAFSQVADLENAASDSTSRESSGRVSREEGNGNISLTGNTQRSDVNANPRTVNLQTFFSRINDGVEQLKNDKLNSVQLRMTLDQGQSVRIHLNLRGQSLKTIIFTDSDTLRAAFRDGWESISRALSEKGVDANELQFSLDDHDGKSSAQDSWEEKDLREKQFATSAMRQAGQKPRVSEINKPSEADTALETSTQRFTRFA